jgi:hypothetical protein
MVAADVTLDELRPLLSYILQEAYLRSHRERDRVDAPKAFLTTVLARLAIDRLRSARARRESYFRPLATGAARRQPRGSRRGRRDAVARVHGGARPARGAQLAARRDRRDPWADGGGKAGATRLPIFGAEKVARLWVQLGRDTPYALEPVDVNGPPARAQ